APTLIGCVLLKITSRLKDPDHPTTVFLRVRCTLQQRSEIMQTSTHIVNRFLTSSNLLRVAQTRAIAGTPAFRTSLHHPSHPGRLKRERPRF
ncbi:hypothetical protein, partial [Paraburkholderia rhizosphaerae]|uniref:hypothetical protein n=1 Tax=Paraburkholderia rhizosphaerae TaxID=480658 RepID=UPI001AB02292